MSAKSKAFLVAIVALLCLPILIHAQADDRKALVLSTDILSREYPRKDVVEMMLKATQKRRESFVVRAK